MPTDIFPVIDIPVVSSVWFYGGLSPDEMQNRITTIVERATTTTVNDIQHIESQTLRGISVIKVFFQPGAKVEAGVAQVNAISETLLRPLPAGHHAAADPAVQRRERAGPDDQPAAATRSRSRSSTTSRNNFIRTQLVTVQRRVGAAGVRRQVAADHGGPRRRRALRARPVAAGRRRTRSNNQNVILPAGTAKMGAREYDVALNGSPAVLADLDELPIKSVNGARREDARRRARARRLRAADEPRSAATGITR